MKKMSGAQKKIVITIACVAGAVAFMGAGFMLARAQKPRIIANIQKEEQKQTSSQNQDAGQDTKYEYEINGITGAVMEKSSEMFQSNSLQGAMAQNPDGQNTGSQDTGSQGQNTGDQSSGGQNSGSQTQQSGLIGIEAAKEIALGDAGLSAGSVTFRKEKQDWDDGIVVYDIEFYTSEMEYEYEIHGTTGAILDRDMEASHNNSGQSSDTGNGGTNDSSPATDIGIDQAKSIAVSHAGLSLSDVTFSKAKQDWDDGYTVYEVEFYYGKTEYDYTIDAYTGTILGYDYDCD